MWFFVHKTVTVPSTSRIQLSPMTQQCKFLINPITSLTFRKTNSSIMYIDSVTTSFADSTFENNTRSSYGSEVLFQQFLFCRWRNTAARIFLHVPTLPSFLRITMLIMLVEPFTPTEPCIYTNGTLPGLKIHHCCLAALLKSTSLKTLRGFQVHLCTEVE